MKIKRQYKYLIKPSADQKEIIIRTCGAVRFVHNRFLEDLKNGKQMDGRAVWILERYRREYPFLKSIDGSALMHAIMRAQDGMRKVKKYKSRKDTFISFTTSNLPKSPVKIVKDSFIFISKLKSIRMVYHRPLPQGALIKEATVMRHPDGKYYVGITIELEKTEDVRTLNFENAIGIDYSSGHFFIDDRGNRVDMPHYFEKMQEKITAERKKMTKMAIGSRHYYEQKSRLAALYDREMNQRHDFIHKLTTRMAEQYDVICMEDLDMKGIAGHLDLGKRTNDNAYGLFSRLLEYKMKERGKLLLYVDRYYPSSKTCSGCGYINRKLTLNDRTWICPECGAVHDRDVNAAINIRRKCIEDYKGRRISGVCLRKQEAYH